MFLKPAVPSFDPEEWQKLPFERKARLICEAWAMQGYGSPLAVYLVYVLKIGAYIGGWVFFCGFSSGMGRLDHLADWWLRPVAFEKAILWSLLFEIAGLGCGSGPLTGRYVPPIGGALYFLRPGTTKLPVFEGVPIIGDSRRSLLDVALYAANAGCIVWALVSDTPARPVLVAIAVLVPVLGILDKTLFLCARGEHFWTTVMVLSLSSDFVPGAKAVHAALWFWAGVSKLNHHFPSVVGVMTSNSPLTRFDWIRRLVYRRYPDDLNPSKFATVMGHAGTLLELTVPVVLLAGQGDGVTIAGLVLMLMLHGFITSNVPMGVPLEWNVMMVYGGFFLFWKNAGAHVLDMPPGVLVFVLAMCALLPLLGNLFPAKVPFLLAMRYYAGNWAYSVWFFREKSHEKLSRLTKSSPWVYDQLERLYEHREAIAIVGKVMAFRLMHLHGRLMSKVIGRTLPRFEDYQWIDGEVIAGLVLGWNFGEGHLHSEQLLRAVQAQCGFEEGELRVVMVESQPLGKSTLHYRIHDAKTGLIEQGHEDVAELRKLQPWGSVVA